MYALIFLKNQRPNFYIKNSQLTRMNRPTIQQLNVHIRTWSKYTHVPTNYSLFPAGTCILTHSALDESVSSSGKPEHISGTNVVGIGEIRSSKAALTSSSLNARQART